MKKDDSTGSHHAGYLPIGSDDDPSSRRTETERSKPRAPKKSTFRGFSLNSGSLSFTNDVSGSAPVVIDNACRMDRSRQGPRRISIYTHLLELWASATCHVKIDDYWSDLAGIAGIEISYEISPCREAWKGPKYSFQDEQRIY